jgi:hypothetical protein
MGTLAGGTPIPAREAGRPRELRAAGHTSMATRLMASGSGHDRRVARQHARGCWRLPQKQQAEPEGHECTEHDEDDERAGQDQREHRQAEDAVTSPSQRRIPARQSARPTMTHEAVVRAAKRVKRI